VQPITANWKETKKFEQTTKIEKIQQATESKDDYKLFRTKNLEVHASIRFFAAVRQEPITHAKVQK